MLKELIRHNKSLIRPYKALSKLNNKTYISLYGLLLGAILNNLGKLEPFLDHFGTVCFFFEVSVFKEPRDLKKQLPKKPVRAIF